jgi:AAA15 family ATPase/GTPase
MRIKSLRLRDFKRFHDLTIDLALGSPRIVALVGPNGSGKSSVLDAFEELASSYKGRATKPATYYKKSLFSGENADADYEPSRHITVVSDPTAFDRKSFYIRSAYRFTPRLAVQSIRKLEDPERDENRPKSLIESDVRLQENYERLIGRFYDDVYDKEVTGKGWAQKNIDGINAVLQNVLEITVSSLGDPVAG